jgi:hypothetical protein
MNWITLKSEVEANINKASITNKKAITAILKLERRVNTLRNKLESGSSWEAIGMSEAYYTAQDILEDQLQEGEFVTEWEAYCNQLGTLSKANLGDHLC